MPVNKSTTTTPKFTAKSFSMATISEPVTFTIDEDKFEAIPANRLPAGALAKYFASINANNLFEAQEFFFSAVLTEDSLKTFNERMNSTDRPITVSLLGDIASWLLGDVYLQSEPTEESATKE